MPAPQLSAFLASVRRRFAAVPAARDVSSLRRRVKRSLAAGLGFAATLALLAAAGVTAHAHWSRLRAPPALVLDVAPGQNFVSAVTALHAARGAAANRFDDRALFATGALRRREALFLAGMETTGAIALNAMPVARGAAHVDLADARALASSLDLADRPRLTAALARLAAAQARSDVRFDRDALGLAAMASAAAIDLELRAEAIAAQTGEGAVTPRAEASFYSVRGAAYGWAAILRAAAADANDPSLADAWGPALASLDRVADAAPLFLSNGDPIGVLRPNHLVSVGLELELAAADLRRFADGAAALSASAN
jgi:hypothetical protein